MRMVAVGLALALVGVMVGCGSDAGDRAKSSEAPPPGDAPAPPVAPGESAIVLTFGPDVLPAVRDRVADLLTKSAPLAVRPLDAAETPPALAAHAIVFSFGATASSRAVVDASALAKLGPEGFVVRSGKAGGKGDTTIVAAQGNAPAAETAAHGNLGTSYAAYALLEELGFAFLHPLAPTV